MINRVVLASVLVMVSVVVSAEDSVGEKILAVDQLFKEVRYRDEHINLEDGVTIEQYFQTQLSMCKDGVELVLHEIGPKVIGKYYKNLESADKKQKRNEFIDNYDFCLYMVRSNDPENRRVITAADIEKRKKKMEKSLELYRSGKKVKVTFVKKQEP
ncbi:hypothetical protein [Neptuniibacter sp. 2_MG-2023]|uniref:hypothetical protein n=1 Tax=Neptuniibacter sp. 2_MG-2023 TaxID=3062671 RepID=UPI0026E39179|nr:hypothetical protein [Neptuniibacter sp. 2_MG-2023]MDO6512942.1 hypothetical protein [Neptuniibacter sp. 2_MG-2023]